MTVSMLQRLYLTVVHLLLFNDDQNLNFLDSVNMADLPFAILFLLFLKLRHIPKDALLTLKLKEMIWLTDVDWLLTLMQQRDMI